MINIQKLFRLQSSKLKKSIYFSTITICNNVKRCSVTSSKSYKLLKCSNNLYVKNNAITLYSTTSSTEAQADFNVFDKACDETLESLTEFFEELVESHNEFENADVSYSGGVLTISLGKYGTYVINRQTPNRQIWLSSPVSGPKRYDYVVNGDYWVYRHDSTSLHELLQSEISKVLGQRVDLSKCLHAKL